jgi:hypothetical protein
MSSAAQCFPVHDGVFSAGVALPDILQLLLLRVHVP